MSRVMNINDFVAYLIKNGWERSSQFPGYYVHPDRIRGAVAVERDSAFIVEYVGGMAWSKVRSIEQFCLELTTVYP
jgi:hypothetical protein